MKCSRWLLVAVCFLGLSWVCLAPDALITVSGVVRGPDGPMAGIFVWTECPPFPGTRTDANGRFSFEIEPLCREVVIVITPVQTNLAQASVRLGSPIEDVELDIELGSGYRLSGQILNNDGCPVAPNYDFFDSLGRKYTLEFDAYARFDTILPPDEYLLQLKPLDGSEGETKRISVDLRSGDVEELVILFNAASALPCLRSPLEREDLGPIEVSGVVRGPDGPMAGIFVWTECPPFPGTRTDTEGAFSIDIEPLCNDVVIVTPPLETNLAQISIRLDHPMNDVQLDIRLSPGHRLSGRVFNIDGCPTVVNHELYASDGRRFTLGLDRDARFDIRLPPDLYDLQMYPPHGSQSEAQHVMIDLRNTSLEGLIVSYNFGSEWLNWGFRPGQEFFEDEPAPLIEHIIFSIIRDDGTRSIRGEAGAIPPGVSNVSLVNLTSGDAAVVHVNEDGSFEAGLFAPEGSFIYAKYARWDGCPDPTYIRGPITGTILRAPANPDVTRDETEFVLSGGMYPEGHWWAEGRVDRLDYSAEDRMTIEGELTLLSRVAAEQLLVGRHTVTLQVELERLTNASGDQILRINRGVSTQVAPTGLPIENGSDGRHSNYTPLSLKWTVQVDETHRDGDKLRIPFSVGGCLPADLAPGLYRPVIWISTNRPGIGIGYHSYVDVAAGELSGAENNMSFGLPVVSIGEPAAPQVPWMLFCNTFSNGQRGLRAREDHDVVGLSTKVLFPTDGFILPPNEETVIRYRLEPFAPTICSSMSEDVEPSPPLIPFAFPSGSLT
ncbi:MAG: hypothetical protein KAI66_09170, partial [Lentisphaeria bacterium]|nr:hypothetical protein [Lentisphaeria bacterium]